MRVIVLLIMNALLTIAITICVSQLAFKLNHMDPILIHATVLMEVNVLQVIVIQTIYASLHVLLCYLSVHIQMDATVLVHQNVVQPFATSIYVSQVALLLKP
jgi:hypothetical protein